MLLGFKPRFVPFVLDGSKTHTIRSERKYPPKVGEVCHCYTGLRQRGPIIQKLASGEVVRQKMARLLGRWPCVKVEEIQIREFRLNAHFGFQLFIEGLWLDVDERNAFAWRDGFRTRGRKHAFAEMCDYWITLHRNHGTIDFAGQVIHWQYRKENRNG